MNYAESKQVNMEVDGNADISELEEQVAQNTADIATNTENISTNTSNIANRLRKNVADTMSGNLTINLKNGTAGTEAISYLILGNNTPRKNDKNSYGRIRMWGRTNTTDETVYRADISPSRLTANRAFTFPDRAGTIALTADTSFVDSYNTSSVVIAANSSADVTLDSHTAPDGLSFRGMIGIYINNTSCQIGNAFALSNTAKTTKVNIKNTSSSSVTLASQAVKATLLYSR